MKEHLRQDSVANTDGNNQILNTLSVFEMNTCTVGFRSLSFVKIAGQTPIQIPTRSMKAVLCTTQQGRVLLKVVNPNVDVNVDVDVTFVNFAFY